MVALVREWTGPSDSHNEVVNLPAGRQGTVVHVFRGGEAFMVEFVAEDGSTDALITTPAVDVRLVRRLGDVDG